MQLNADLGETEVGQAADTDAPLMPLLDQANIACGYHAGDLSTMQHTVALALANNVSIGAHPSYPDREHFGRRSMSIPKERLSALIHDQIDTLEAIAQAQGASIDYVKPHGALYNDMMADPALLETVLHCISRYPRPLKLMVLANVDREQTLALAKQHSVDLLFEGFADRAYNDDGSLVSRQQPNAVLDAPLALNQAKQLIQSGNVTTVSGNTLSLNVDSLCVHGDNPAALLLAKAIRDLIT